MAIPRLWEDLDAIDESLELSRPSVRFCGVNTTSSEETPSSLASPLPMGSPLPMAVQPSGAVTARVRPPDAGLVRTELSVIPQSTESHSQPSLPSQHSHVERLMPQRAGVTRIGMPRSDSSASTRSSSTFLPSNSHHPGGAFHPHEIPKAFRLPRRDEFSFEGFLQRQKGHWKKKWAKELFIIHHGVLLTCTKESPFLVKICVPLKNITNVEVESTSVTKAKSKKSGFKFNIHHLQAARKDSSELAVMHVMADSEADRTQWVRQITLHRDRLLKVSDNLMDLVDRDRAKKTISQLHDAMRNAGLSGMVTRLFNLLKQWRKHCLHEAFHMLREFAAQRGIKLYKEKLEAERTAELQALEVTKQAMAAEDRKAEKLRRIALGVTKLVNFRNHRVQTYILALQHTAATKYVQGKVQNANVCMTAAVQVQKSLEAQREIFWRKTKLSRALIRVFRNSLHRSFADLKHGADIICMEARLKKETIQRLVSKRWQNMCDLKSKAVRVWVEECRRRREVMSALEQFFQSQEDRRVARTVSRWALVVAVERRRVVHGSDNLAKFCIARQRMQMAYALRKLVEWREEVKVTNALQICNDFSSAQGLFVDAYNEVPVDRGCYRLAILYQKLNLKSKFRGLNAFVRYRSKKIQDLCACRMGLDIIEWLYVRRLSQGFSRFMVFFQVKQHHVTSRQSATFELTICLRSLMRKVLTTTLMQWKRSVEYYHTQEEHKLLQHARLSAINKFATALSPQWTRARHNKLLWAFHTLRLNSERASILHGMLRVQLLQRIVQLVDRVRVSTLTKAFMCLRASPFVTQYAAEAAAEQALQTSNAALTVLQMPLSTVVSAQRDDAVRALHHVLDGTSISNSDDTPSITSSAALAIAGVLNCSSGDSSEWVLHAPSTPTHTVVHRQRLPKRRRYFPIKRRTAAGPTSSLTARQRIQFKEFQRARACAGLSAMNVVQSARQNYVMQFSGTLSVADKVAHMQMQERRLSFGPVPLPSDEASSSSISSYYIPPYVKHMDGVPRLGDNRRSSYSGSQSDLRSDARSRIERGDNISSSPYFLSRISDRTPTLGDGSSFASNGSDQTFLSRLGGAEFGDAYKPPLAPSSDSRELFDQFKVATLASRPLEWESRVSTDPLEDSSSSDMPPTVEGPLPPKTASGDTVIPLREIRQIMTLMPSGSVGMKTGYAVQGGPASLTTPRLSGRTGFSPPSSSLPPHSDQSVTSSIRMRPWSPLPTLDFDSIAIGSSFHSCDEASSNTHEQSSVTPSRRGRLSPAYREQPVHGTHPLRDFLAREFRQVGAAYLRNPFASAGTSHTRQVSYAEDSTGETPNVEGSSEDECLPDTGYSYNHFHEITHGAVKQSDQNSVYPDESLKSLNSSNAYLSKEVLSEMQKHSRNLSKAYRAQRMNNEREGTGKNTIVGDTGGSYATTNPTRNQLNDASLEPYKVPSKRIISSKPQHLQARFQRRDQHFHNGISVDHLLNQELRLQQQFSQLKASQEALRKIHAV